ncbi:hypothetical protein [Streptomyces sp. NPDC050564]|uniref:hypothetical protein n=1 Tax=Streptomyces sp. NPDC050564 TaxID=3365631 RepID=UPI00378DE501
MSASATLEDHDRVPRGSALGRRPPHTAAAMVGFRVRSVFGGNIIATGTDFYRLAHTKNQQGNG